LDCFAIDLIRNTEHTTQIKQSALLLFGCFGEFGFQTMPSAKTTILEYVCPSLGALLSNLMFSAPFRDVRAAVKKGTLGHLNPTPWAVMTGNTIGWVSYAFLIDNLYIFFANAPGLILSIWLNLSAVKLLYGEHRVREVRDAVVKYLEEGSDRHLRVEEEPDERPVSQKAVNFAKIVLQVTAQKARAPAAHEKIVLCIVFIWVSVLSLLRFANFSSTTRELIVGILVNVNLLFFYGAPLSTIFTVLKTRNSASIHIRTMTTNTLNGAFWSAYGFAVNDPFVYVPNALGAGLGVIQMVLVLVVPRRIGDKDDDDDDLDSEDDLDDLESYASRNSRSTKRSKTSDEATL
jgi:solute carrier family 50 protein (sugar transporter)